MIWRKEQEAWKKSLRIDLWRVSSILQLQSQLKRFWRNGIINPPHFAAFSSGHHLILALCACKTCRRHCNSHSRLTAFSAHLLLLFLFYNNTMNRETIGLSIKNSSYLADKLWAILVARVSEQCNSTAI